MQLVAKEANKANGAKGIIPLIHKSQNISPFARHCLAKANQGSDAAPELEFTL